MGKRKKEWTAYQKGIDFTIFFAGKSFTIRDIEARYVCCYRQAQRLLADAHAVIDIRPVGLEQYENGRWANKWRIA